MSSRRAKTLVAGVWLFSFVIGCPPLIGWNDTIDIDIDHNETTTTVSVTTTTVKTTDLMYIHCENDVQGENFGNISIACSKSMDTAFIIACELTNSRGYRIYAALGSFFIPMLVMVFFYLQIYRAAMRTIAAYEKGELKTKFSGQEKSSGRIANSVTLRIHRGGRSFSGRNSECGNFTGSFRGSIASPVQKDDIVEKSTNGRSLGRGEGFFGNSSIRKARSSDASLVTLTDLASEAMDNESAKRNSICGPNQKTCWDTDKKCQECSNQSIYTNGSQNGRSTGNKLYSKRCLSMDSEERSSSEAKSRKKHSSDHQRVSIHSSLPITTSTSCQTSDHGIVLVRGMSTNEHNRRPRFSAHKPVNAMKLHMQKFNREKKAAKTLAVIVGAFIFCWMPFFTTYLVGAFCDSCISPMMFSVAFWLGYCNSAMNPFVYALFSRDFRFAFRRLVMCGCEIWHKKRSFRRHNSDVPTIQLHCAPQEEPRSSSDIDGQWR